MPTTTPAFCARCGTSVAANASFCPRCGTGIPGTPADALTTVSVAAPGSAQDALLDTLRQVTLGEYEIVTVLGRGGMATVYLAHDLPLDRKVAIKVLAPALLAMGEGMVERFKREARTAAALSHPHIIPIYAVKESNQILYFVMKYVQGRALDAVIHDAGPLPIKMVQTILGHVGDALGYAHRRGVIHRDIKSANIMLDEEGGAVVTDFGIAKVQEAQGLTLTGVTVGTPAYMSPEQCATCEVTGATDQYSLGVVAYEMLTGGLPFQSTSSMSVMYAHFNQRPRALTELRPDCPPNLAAAVMRMLEKEPEDRWPTMDDVVAVCGRPSLQRDDTVRAEIIALAKGGEQSRRLADLTVPTSPIVASKPPTRVIAPVPRRAPWWWWGGGVAAAGIAALLWVAAPWRLLRTPSGSPADSVRVTSPPAAPLGVDRAPVAPPRDSTPARIAQRPVRPTAPFPVASAGRQEDSVLNSLRAAALAAMRRAVVAGATRADLARADSALRVADSLVVAGRPSEAMVEFVTATSLWREVERAARARAARDSALAAVPPQVPPARPVPPPPPPPPAALDPRASIESVIAGYARALETRDTSQVRRAYPGITAAQLQGWGDFFGSVRNLKASLAVTTLNLAGGGDTADAMVSGVYQFDNISTGRTVHRPVTFRASLVADSAGWRLSAIH